MPPFLQAANADSMAGPMSDVLLATPPYFNTLQTVPCLLSRVVVGPTRPLSCPFATDRYSDRNKNVKDICKCMALLPMLQVHNVCPLLLAWKPGGL